MGWREKIDTRKLPQHIAIIMDGNGRWAKKHGQIRTFGHHEGVKSVKDVVEGAAELGISYLTLYTFSTENWNRPISEVNALMELLVDTMHEETPTLIKNNVKLAAIGDIGSLPKKCQQKLAETIKITSVSTGLTLVLALSYSSRWELLDAINTLIQKVKKGETVPDNITEHYLKNFLCTANMPDPELLIRTSGEKRISNFLLWQIAYTELYFTDVLWPDFTREDLFQAIVDYQQRERRFGVISEQLA
ncbi:MAG: isoprenyl transferase [Flavobacteriales bacterium]|nr:isoprenyl transferase [Flavobacteriales bacterium]